jgi:hypothetical protein
MGQRSNQAKAVPVCSVASTLLDLYFPGLAACAPTHGDRRCGSGEWRRWIPPIQKANHVLLSAEKTLMDRPPVERDQLRSLWGQQRQDRNSGVPVIDGAGQH